MDIEEHSDDTGGKSLKEAQEVIDMGHPPIAEGVILIDFDGTIAPFGYLFDFPDPLPGAVEALQAFDKAGWKIVIFTSRLSPIWLETVGQSLLQHIEYINAYLERFANITPYAITAQKVPAYAYIDDKAYRYDNNWKELVDTILPVAQ